MKLQRAHIRNFKLLENIELEFSSSRRQPLTVIRAENGSGKTSILWALLWAFYGEGGLPKGAKGLRLTSSASPKGTPVEVQVSVEFCRDDLGSDAQYQLIRTVQETPRGGDAFDRGPARVRLLRRTAAGHEDVPGDAGALMAKFLPPRLKSVFFTDGDDVQRFISGESAHGRQARVNDAIQALLGLDLMKVAQSDLEFVSRKMRKEAASEAGADLEQKERELDEVSEQIANLEKQLEDETERSSQIASSKEKTEKELLDIRGAGDIDELNSQILQHEALLDKLEGFEENLRGRMKSALSRQETTWSLAGEILQKGYSALDALADRGVIPGTSIEVLADRLHLNECICGEDLSVGTAKRAQVEQLREEQRRISAARGRQTSTFHSARMGRAEHLADVENGNSFPSIRKSLLEDFSENREQIRAAGHTIEGLKQKRSLIDEEEVQKLSDRIQNAAGKLNAASRQIGKLETQLVQLREQQTVAQKAYEKAERAARVSNVLEMQRAIATDMNSVIAGTISELETGSIGKVSERMNSLFMSIVGSDPEAAGAVFRNVHINEKFDIVINTVGDGHLDPDFEVNGASQRALTLSFIWSLMEVSNQVAPRIIDTPLGMTAGGVKRRMVEAITSVGEESPDFQVVLLLTRSEIRDIEDLLSERAGSFQTLSCNKDYPTDLVNDWELDRPVVRRCDCRHEEFCVVCARRYDADHGLVERRA